MSEVSYSDVEGSRKFIIKDESGQIVGHAVATPKDKSTLELNSIQVNPPKRRQGYASHLLDEVINYARHIGATKIEGDFVPEYRTESDRKAAHSFYEKHGLRVHNGRLVGSVVK